MRVLSLFFLLVLLGSCRSSELLQLGNNAANKGIQVSQQALEIYTMLDEQAAIDKKQQDELKVLTHPDPARMSLPDTKIFSFNAQLAPRRKAYQNLLNAYKAFSLLTDPKYGSRNESAVSALQDAYNDIKALPNLPAAVSSKLPTVLKIISQSIQVKNIKQQHEILFSITDLFHQLWEADKQIWEEYLDRVYDDYAAGLNTVDVNKYSVKKIPELAKLPYSDDTILLYMYRLKIREDIINEKNALKKQLTDFGKTLLELNRLHAELSRSKNNIQSIQQLFVSIDNLLKSK